MTDRDKPQASPGDRGHPRRWLWWPISCALAVGGAIAFYNDAVTINVLWLYWLVVYVLVAFYAIAAGFYLFRLGKFVWRRWMALVNKARAHQEISDELARWKKAAAVATARAEDAEERLQTSHYDRLKEGRRRVLAELQAATASTTFKRIEVALSEDLLVIGAKWKNESPQIDARYVLQTKTLKETKAVLECVQLRQNGTALFRIAAVASESYRAALIARSHTGDVLSDVEIVARTQDLKEEPIWPES